ncbi:MAG TPA: fumarylacetoacetase, partial [Thermoanaerobaculia bacterium]
MSDFPIENLPFGVFRRDGDAHICTAIDDRILDLHAIADVVGEPALREPLLNALMGKGTAGEVRTRVAELLQRGSVDEHLVPMSGAEMLLPARVGDYTDFYASVHHATNVGSMFR